MKKTISCKKALFGLAILTSPFISFSNSTITAEKLNSDTICLTGGKSGELKIQFRTIYDSRNQWSGGYVKYGKNKPITLAFKKSTSTIISKSASYESETVWLEIGKTGITGQYTMISQGTSVESLTYKKMNSAKEYDFIDVTGVFLDDDYECSFTKQLSSRTIILV